MFLKLAILSAFLTTALTCLCLKTSNVVIREEPCGQQIGGGSEGQCFPDLGGRESCYLGSDLWEYCEVEYNDGPAWIACDYLRSADPSECDIVTCDGVRLIPREEWGARPPKDVTSLELPLGIDFIHHSASSHCYTEEDCKEEVRAIQNYHMNVNGYDDIGYNFLIGEDGNAYEGRGWENQGAHVSGWNSQSHGFCVIGTFISGMPNNAALDALQAMIDCGVAEEKTEPDYTLYGHRDGVCTSCPGATFYDGWVVPHPHYKDDLDGGCRKWEWGTTMLYN